jgi:class 3 adenylate cyclase/tetratricopeptide (TPR) repeat protein
MRACPNCRAADTDAAAYCRSCGSAMLPLADSGLRSFVTVVRCDVANSTALAEGHDPEFVRRVMVRYLETARQALERHGGTLERFVGDEVVAIFGLPVTREDDALRAVRAAVELHARLAVLNTELETEMGIRVPVRTGVESGEVALGADSARQVVMAGEVFNVATRLEQAAEPGSILVGEATWRLVRNLLDAEPAGTLALKGKSDPVAAYRVKGVLPFASSRAYGPEAPLVGRAKDQALLRAAYERTLQTRCCHLVAILGPAGIGKSRLVQEFTRDLTGDALVLHGRCPEFSGAAYQPIVEIIQRAAGIEVADPELTRARLIDLVGEDPLASRITERIAQILGLRGGAGPRDDVHWAMRRLLEIMAGRQPVVLVLDDLHRGEVALFDLVEEISQSSRHVPILLVCLARPELLDSRRLGVLATDGATLRLSTLSPEESGELVVALLGGAETAPEIRDYVAECSGGNPLFAHMLVATLREEGLLELRDNRWVPTEDLSSTAIPTEDVKAAIRSRLHRLSGEELSLLQRAAVIGRHFSARAVSALTPEPDQRGVELTLRSLIRKELIVPGAPITVAVVRRDDGYAFGHGLIQEVAYAGSSMDARALLHERFANWLSEMAADRPDLDELVGHHFEQAYETLAGAAGTGDGNDRTRRLARQAGEALAASGHRTAVVRGIPDAAIPLLRRALGLLHDNDPVRRAALLDLADSLCRNGEIQAAEDLYEQLIRASEQAGDPEGAARGRLGLLELEYLWQRTGRSGDPQEELERAVQVFESLHDDLGLARAWHLRAYERWRSGQLALAHQAAEHVIGLARRAGNEQLEAQGVSTRCYTLFWSEASIQDITRYTNQALEWARTRGIRTLEADSLRIIARVRAMQGRFNEARELLARADRLPIPPGERPHDARAVTRYHGNLLVSVGDYISVGIVELLAGEPRQAETALRHGYEELSRMGGRGNLSPVVTLLARTLAVLGKDAEAERMTGEIERLSSGGLRDGQVKWRSIRALLLARRGEHARAQSLAQEAEPLLEDWDQLDTVAEIHTDLAAVASYAGRSRAAERHARAALARYDRKGNAVGVARAQALLADLGAA